MIKNWLVRGDCHGKISWMNMIPIYFPDFKPEETAIIILGDAGFNFYLDERDLKLQNEICENKYTIYIVRGNHEQRPERIEGITTAYDRNVKGDIWINPKFFNIRYFKDGGAYNINGKSILTIGGAYSVDKPLRLNGAQYDDELSYIKLAGWFPYEQLDADEQNAILKDITDKSFDFILTHTCPMRWEPTDLFTSGLDQKTVDKTTEKFLNKVSESCQWKIWLFGHYHADRLERPHVEQLYNNIEDLNNIWNTWYGGENFTDNWWWKTKSPSFYMQGDVPWNV